MLEYGLMDAMVSMTTYTDKLCALKRQEPPYPFKSTTPALPINHHSREYFE